MSTVYWLTFALTLVPVLSQIVGTAFVIHGFSLLSKPLPKRWLPAWLPLVFAAFAFALMFWQITHNVDLFFPDFSSSDLDNKTIMGVTVPLEVADKVQAFVDALISLMLSAFIVYMFVRALLPNSGLLTWAGRLIVLALLALYASVSWSLWIRNIQDLIQLF